MMHRTVKATADGSGFHMVVGQTAVGHCVNHAPHATEAEARECFGQYQRDQVRERGTSRWTNCMVREPNRCTNPARRQWEIEGDGYTMAVLCDEHSDREHAIVAMQLEGPAGDAWFS